MSCRGIYQLQRIYIQFCDWGGSSKGVRKLLESNEFKQFVKENPQIDFEFCTRRNRHPYMSSTYINGFIKDFPLLNLKDEEILDAMNRVRNQSGRKYLPHKGQRVYSTKKSIQGQWQDGLWDNLYPQVELEKIRGPKQPEIQFELVDKETNQTQKVYHKDIVNSIINQKEKKWEKGQFL